MIGQFGQVTPNMGLSGSSSYFTYLLLLQLQFLCIYTQRHSVHNFTKLVIIIYFLRVSMHMKGEEEQVGVIWKAEGCVCGFM